MAIPAPPPTPLKPPPFAIAAAAPAGTPMATPDMDSPPVEDAAPNPIVDAALDSATETPAPPMDAAADPAMDASDMADAAVRAVLAAGTARVLRRPPSSSLTSASRSSPSAARSTTR